MSGGSSRGLVNPKGWESSKVCVCGGVGLQKGGGGNAKGWDSSKACVYLRGGYQRGGGGGG